MKTRRQVLKCTNAQGLRTGRRLVVTVGKFQEVKLSKEIWKDEHE